MTAAERWHALLRPDVELSAAFCDRLAAEMRAAKVTYGDRLHCPFLRPFFLEAGDEERIRRAGETIAALGERVAQAALADPGLLAQVRLSPDEERLARIDPGYRTASTASRLDSFLLPDSLQFAEYNGESPAGLGYAQTLAEIFERLEIMGRLRERRRTRSFPIMENMHAALMASYREWGGTASPPVVAIVDWREVPTWSEFEILAARFERLGTPAILCDPRDLEFSAGVLWGRGRKIELVYRRVLINDIVARPAECRALIDAYAAGAVCVCNTLQCKIPHKKAFFALLTDERNAPLFTAEERAIIGRHVPWTRVVADVRTTRDGRAVDLLEYARGERAHLVLKPSDEYGGAGVTLGWEVSESEWDAALQRALGSGVWIVQERIQVRREVFPQVIPGRGVLMTEMLVDFSPYLFRGRLAGFLTRLSATGLANVTSGGGQAPCFVVE
jgi:uncharacterized circularly permuted ATP-grasp superfamily protein